MNNKTFFSLLRYAAIIGNTVFMLWIMLNGVQEGLQGTLVEKVSYVGLLLLLFLNNVLLLNMKAGIRPALNN